MNDQPLLEIRDLRVEFNTDDGVVRAVDGVSFDVFPGEVLGVVGESGSGKSVTAMSILGLIRQPPGKITGGTIGFRGKDLLRMKPKELRRVRGGDIAMVFQDPMTALNPVITVGQQITEALHLHNANLSAAGARERAVALLALVGVPDPPARFRQYPHEYSGGMRQRAMIAMAIANDPALLIADEPTTALDVTIQAQVLALLRKAARETGAATILITHDLGVIAELADRIVVMYAGRIVETGDVKSIFANPRHPYTRGLLDSLPRLDQDTDELKPIAGSPPSLIDVPSGCAFHPRCAVSQGRERCRTERPELEVAATGQLSACHFHAELRPAKQPEEASA